MVRRKCPCCGKEIEILVYLKGAARRVIEPIKIEVREVK